MHDAVEVEQRKRLLGALLQMDLGLAARPAVREAPIW
jgi:hypothetical protein